MKTKYLNYSQARAICQDYQYLVGASYEEKDHETDLVTKVVIAPYSRILQWQFLRSIQRGMPQDEALRINTNGRYDVLVLPEQRHASSLTYRMKPLRTYTREHNIDFDPGTYNCFRAL